MPRDGVLLVLFASLWFSAATMLVKAVGPEVPVVWVAFLRCAVALGTVAMLMRRLGVGFRSPHWVRLFLRGIWGVSAMVCLFWALPRMPIANAMLISHVSPLYAALWGVLFLGERLDRLAVLCIAVAFGGVCLTLRSEISFAAFSSTSGAAPYAAALASGLLASVAIATIKSLTRDEPALRIVFYFSLVGTAVFLPWVLISGYRPTAAQWGMMGGVGVAATAGQALLTVGLGRAPVSRAGIGVLFIIVVNIAGGWLFWGEIPDPWTWLGCLLVLGGILGLSPALRRRLAFSPA
ncbi:MAG: DMT family transporter [Elusimicrobiota bacterium]